MTNGTLFLIRINLRQVLTISSWIFQTAATTPTPNENYVGIFTSSATVVASSATGAADAVNGIGGNTCELSTPYTTAASGFIWVGPLFNAATAGVTVQSGISGGTYLYRVPGISNARFATNGTGLTALLSSITPANNNVYTNAIWAAVS